MRRKYAEQEDVHSLVKGAHIGRTDMNMMVNKWLPTLEDPDNFLDPNSARPEVPPDMQYECDELPSHADEIGDAFLELPVYKEIITGHSAYDWLLQISRKSSISAMAMKFW
jgi:hypothetical protein